MLPTAQRRPLKCESADSTAARRFDQPAARAIDALAERHHVAWALRAAKAVGRAAEARRAEALQVGGGVQTLVARSAAYPIAAAARFADWTPATTQASARAARRIAAGRPNSLATKVARRAGEARLACARRRALRDGKVAAARGRCKPIKESTNNKNIAWQKVAIRKLSARQNIL